MKVADYLIAVRQSAARSEARRIIGLVLPTLPPLGEKARTILALFR